MLKWSLTLGDERKTRVRLGIRRSPILVKFVSLIDGRRTMGEIVAAVRSTILPSPTSDEVWKIACRLIDLLLQIDLLLLRHCSHGANAG